MRVIARRTLREFWEGRPDAERPLRAWLEETEQAVWKSPNEIKRSYANASVVGESRLVFNIKGNDYRLVVYVNYITQTVYVKFIGSHAEYDRVDVATIQLRNAHGN